MAQGERTRVPRVSVVILSGRGLFAEGVISRLRRQADRVEVHVVAADQPQAFERVVSARPAAVILDASDADIANSLPLSRLLEVLPEVRVLRLDPERDRVHVVTSEQHQASEIADLFSVIVPPAPSGGVQGSG